jgi:hypothetical protein
MHYILPALGGLAPRELNESDLDRVFEVLDRWLEGSVSTIREAWARIERRHLGRDHPHARLGQADQ